MNYRSCGLGVQRSQFIKSHLYSILFGEAVGMQMVLKKYIFSNDKEKYLLEEA
jgi:hypothetical protein